MSWKLAAIVLIALCTGVVVARLSHEEGGTAVWDASRASAFAGYVLVWASVMVGLALSLRLRMPGLSKTWSLETHRILSALALSFVLTHILATILDPFVHFKVLDGVVPFTSAYRPLQVGLGTIATWLLVAVLGSTAMAGAMPFRAWRWLHALAFPCWVLALVHGLTAGTDTGSLPAVLLYAITGAWVAWLAVLRLYARRQLPVRRETRTGAAQPGFRWQDPSPIRPLWYQESTRDSGPRTRDS
jgi:sulfoxide reductase heme-binding subunit YedZ